MPSLQEAASNYNIFHGRTFVISLQYFMTVSICRNKKAETKWTSLKIIKPIKRLLQCQILNNNRDSFRKGLYTYSVHVINVTLLKKKKNGVCLRQCLIPHERNETSLYLFCSLSHLSQLYPNQRHTKTLRNRIYKPSHKQLHFKASFKKLKIEPTLLT